MDAPENMGKQWMAFPGKRTNVEVILDKRKLKYEQVHLQFV